MSENELTPFIMKDTGKTVLIKKVSPLLLMELRKAFKEPKPPSQEVEINGRKVIEENRAHPDFKAALEAYNIEFETRMRRLLINRGVVVTMTDEVKAEVAALRAEWEEETGSPLTGSDSYIYVSYIAIGTEEDMNDLIAEITQRSQPTPSEVELAKRTFPG